MSLAALLAVVAPLGLAAPASAEGRAVITKSEYRMIKKGESYPKVTRIADGRGEYIGQCVEGGPCGKNIRWYWWRSTSGKHVWVAFARGDGVVTKFPA